MPIGLQRLNARHSQPNAAIVFIKPLPGPSAAIAQNFLERVAAICHPITAAAHISVVTLEEYEPNREFVGRNFNNGEIIQLVLKSCSGRWLPFNYVAMVMMHELAHCKQMNHSRVFWAVRNGYAAQLRELWQRGYTGEGIWGRGQTLYDGQYTADAMPDAADMPEHLCGGTYRRVRKRKPQLSSAEQRERCILKKFGEGGITLGDDELTRRALEKKRVQGKPRVAQSKRGRELRAAAVAARLGQAAGASSGGSSRITDYTGGVVQEPTSDSAWDDVRDEDIKPDVTIGDIHFIKQEEADDDFDMHDDFSDLDCAAYGDGGPVAPEAPDEWAFLEMKEEADIETASELISDVASKRATREAEAVAPKAPLCLGDNMTHSNSETASEATASVNQPQTTQATTITPANLRPPTSPSPATPPIILRHPSTTPTLPALKSYSTVPPITQQVCSICSLDNTPDAATCSACAHVLQPSLIPNHWRCGGETCIGSAYVNAGDAGLCGLCGRARGK